MEEENLLSVSEGILWRLRGSAMFAGLSGAIFFSGNTPGVSKRKFVSFLRRLLRFFLLLPPTKLVLLGYLSYILFGWLLLCLPISQLSPGVAALDNLFIATSAVSTTGLVPVSVSDSYTFFGQLVVLLLIQLGGIGYMTIGSFVILSRADQLSELRAKIGFIVFPMPASFRLDNFIRSVVRFTLLIEAVGALLLYLLFRNAGVASPLWKAVFHSISAFCTAGFSLNNSSFESFAGHFWINVVIAALGYLGAIGFIVCIDFWRMLARKVRRITLTSKIIIWMTAWLTVIGTLLLFLTEPSIARLPPHERLLAAFFQCITAMTTVGFNTISIAGLSKASILLLLVLMVIGASPSGTGGGVKSTTVSVLVGFMAAAFRGREEITFWGHPIPRRRVVAAVANLGFYILALIIGAYCLDLLENAPFDKCFFETASALGTVGLSMGITPELSDLGKVLIILMMYAGRVGPLTLAVGLFAAEPAESVDRDADLAI